MARYHAMTSRTSALTSTLAANAVLLGIGVATGIITARGLGPTDRGVLIALILWVGVVGVIAVRGLDEAVIWAARGQGEHARRLRSAVFKTLGISTPLCFAAFFPLGLGIIGKPWGTAAQTVLVVALVIPLNVTTQLAFSVLRTEQRTLSWNLLRVAPQFIYLGGITVLLLFNELSLWRAASALFVANLATAVFATRMLRFGEKSTRSPSKDDVNRVRRYGGSLLKSQLPMVLGQRVDQLILAGLGTASALSVYAVAASIAATMQLAATTAEQFLFPRYCMTPPTKRSVAYLSGSLVLGLSVLPGAAYVWGDTILTVVYGPYYAQAQAALTWLALAMTFQGGIAPLIALAKASGRLRILLWNQWMRLGLIIAMTIIFNRELTVVGVAVSVAMSGGLSLIGLALALLGRGPR